MSAEKRLDRVYQSALCIPFNSSSRFIIMSDCHRGDASWADDFLRNQNLYFAAMTYYYQKGYTYIELGDGDELWENTQMSDIFNAHSDVFWLLSKFYRACRLFFIYGNHDIIKRNEKWVSRMNRVYNERKKKETPLFPDVHYYESLMLRHSASQNTVFLIHGHQADFLNDTLWKFARFLVRHFWRPLELLGIRDPTSAAKNHDKKEVMEKKLMQWSQDNKQILIAGHTHRSVFAKDLTQPYLNDGCCVHPRCITGIEIVNDEISLIKWSQKTRDDGTLYIGRDILAGPKRLSDYWQALSGKEKAGKAKGKAADAAKTE